MGIIDRIKMNIRANLNYALDKAQDPQKIFNQFLLEMRESIQEFKGAILNAVAGVKKLEREITESAEKATQWEERSLLALKNSNEELARKAVEQKIAYQDRENNLKKELEKQKQLVEELKVSLSKLELQLNELYQKKNELLRQYMQARSAAVSKSVTQTPEFAIDMGVFDTYDAMVDKVQTLEAQVEALSELTKVDETEQQFRKMEKESQVEAELEAIKSKAKDEKPQT